MESCEIACFGPPIPKIFFACGALNKEGGLAALADRYPIQNAPPRQVWRGGAYPSLPASWQRAGKTT